MCCVTLANLTTAEVRFAFGKQKLAKTRGRRRREWKRKKDAGSVSRWCEQLEVLGSQEEIAHLVKIDKKTR